MRRSCAVALGLAVFAIGVWMPEPAEACFRGPGAGAPSIDVTAPAQEDVPPDGPVVLPVEAHGADAESFAEAVEIEAVGTSGDHISGEVRLVELWRQFSDAYRNHRDHPFQRWLLVWEPDVRMLQQEPYDVEVDVDRSRLANKNAIDGASESFAIKTSTPSARALPSPDEVDITNVHETISQNGESSCDSGAGGDCPSCRFTDELDTIRLRAGVDDRRYRRPDVVYELRSTGRAPVVDRRSRHWGGPSIEEESRAASTVGPSLHFRPNGEEKCVELVVRSLTDDRERVADEHCLEGHHDPPPDAGDTGIPEHDVGPPPPEDTGSPRPDTGHPDDRLPDHGVDPTFDSGSADPETGPRLPWGGDRGRDGCSCSTDSSSPPPSSVLWAVLAMAGTWRMRRRRKT